VELLGRTLGGSILLETHLGSTLATLVDPIQLETALLNLAINARDAMVGGGKLRLETNMASFDAPIREHGELIAPGQYVRIAVSDTGCGISEADLERVFEPFFTTKDTGKGSGLGLSMVYGFVKQSKGHVRIESETDVGTTVELLLPIANATPRSVKVSPEPGESARERDHRTVLVVEDDAALRRITEELLASLDYRTHAAGDARSALDLLRRVPSIDALLTDVILPGGIHGPELARRVRERVPEMPVLFMSGHTADALSADRRLEPGIPLLKKPFRKTELEEALQALFRDSPSGTCPLS
jgi:CheY-like chemotaxis protein